MRANKGQVIVIPSLYIQNQKITIIPYNYNILAMPQMM